MAFVFLLTLASCSKGVLKEDDDKHLTEKFAQLQELSLSVTCEDATEWKFIGIGAKACGGFTSYIAYSSEIDTLDFLKKAQDYTNAMSAYNKKWNIISDCSLVLPPDHVICEDGKPKLIYQNRGL
jgi:hypothetical protein